MAVIVIVSFTNTFALTYLPEDTERGGMWANVLADTSEKFKNTDGSFIADGGWSDAHNLLGAIPETQNPYSPTHSSIVTMAANDWVILSFEDDFGNQLVVNNDPTNPDGYDAIVWGNAFYSYGGPSVWAEPGSIYLSQDGIDWWALPACIYQPVDGTHQTFDLTPGYGDGLVSPGAPWEFDALGESSKTGLAGGDAFDMYTAYFVGDLTDPTDDNAMLVGLDWFAFIMLSGKAPGDEVQSGPDPDSVYVFSTSTAPVPLPTAVWLLGSGLAALIGLRRRGSF